MIDVDRCRIEWDRKGESEKDRHELKFNMRSKKIDVDRCRIEWDKKGDIEKDRHEFILTKR